MRARRLLIASLVVLDLVAVALPAAAGDGPGGWVDVDDDGSGVDLGAVDGQDGGAGEDGPTSTACTWERVSDVLIDGIWWELDPNRTGPLANPDDYIWYAVTCPDGNGGETVDLVPVPVTEPAETSVPSLRDRALDNLSLPSPSIGTNPSGDQVVHLATWLWVDDAIWRSYSKSVTAGAVTTTVVAAPRRVIWDLGNGDAVVCDGPGTPYDPSIPSDEQATDCSYTYTHTSAGQPGDAYQATATIEWTASWTVTGAPGGGPLPALYTSSPVAVRVSEMQALNQ